MLRRQEGIRQHPTRISAGDTKETVYKRSCAETDKVNLSFSKYTPGVTGREGHKSTRKHSAIKEIL